MKPTSDNCEFGEFMPLEWKERDLTLWMRMAHIDESYEETEKIGRADIVRANCVIIDAYPHPERGHWFRLMIPLAVEGAPTSIRLFGTRYGDSLPWGDLADSPIFRGAGAGEMVALLAMASCDGFTEDTYNGLAETDRFAMRTRWRMWTRRMPEWSTKIEQMAGVKSG